jgi:hypothetical protein
MGNSGGDSTIVLGSRNEHEKNTCDYNKLSFWPKYMKQYVQPPIVKKENKITHFITSERILISDEGHVLQGKIKSFIHQTTRDDQGLQGELDQGK